MSDFVAKSACGSFVIILIVAISLIASSFYVIEPNTVALDYNKVSQEIGSEKLYDSGRFFLGVGHEMISYTTTQLNVDLAFQTGRTKDGLTVGFNCNYQFQYVRTLDSLTALYKDYKNEHLKTYNFLATAKIRDVLARYTAFNVILLRDTLSLEMKQEVADELILYGAKVTSLQVGSLQLPQPFVDAIERTIIVEQNIETAEFELNRAVINGETLRLTAEIEADLMVVSAEAEATSIGNIADATAEGLTAQLDSEASSYKALFDQLKIDYPGAFDKTQLLSLIKAESITSSNVGSIRVQMENKA